MKRVIYVLAFCHLAFAAGAISHRVDGWIYQGPWEKPLLLYSGLSYSFWRFGFFAPDVGKSIEVEIKAHGDDSSTHSYSTLRGFRFFTTNLESANRFYVFKLRSVREKTLRDLAARSVAARILNLHPDASSVDYTLRSVRFPSMAEYQNGLPVQYVELYSTTFALHGIGEKQESNER